MSGAGLIFHGIIAASTLVDVFVGLAVASRLARHHGDPLGGRLNAPAVVVACLAGAFFAAGKMAILVILGLSFFALLRFVFLELVVGVPVAAGLILWAGTLHVPGLGRVRPTWLARLLLVLLLAPAPVGAYAVFVEPQRLVLETAEVPIAASRPGATPIRVAVLADLQFREVSAHEHRAVALAMAQQPDVIVLPGDVFAGPWPEYELRRQAIIDLLSPLDAPGGVYLVEGDHDTDAVLADLARSTRLQWLRNEITSFTVRDQSVSIAGVDLDYRSPAAIDVLQRISRSEAEVRMVLAHRPDVVYTLADDDAIDLVIAGHTHGGQVQIPGFGPVVTLSAVPRRAAGGGLSVVDGQALYISRGIGMERGWAPPIRFHCAPEVSLLSLGSTTR